MYLHFEQITFFILFLFPPCKQFRQIWGCSYSSACDQGMCRCTLDKVSRIPRDHPYEKGSWKRETDIMGMAIMIERAKATAGGAGRRDFSRLLYWNSLDFFSEIPKSVRYCHRIFHPFFTSFRRITTMTTSFIRDTIHLLVCL